MTTTELPDISAPADIDRLVTTFYDAVLTDPIIGFLFEHLDLRQHLPVISAFWQQQLLGRPGYRGQTFAVHRRLHARSALTADHFHRWLYLFGRTVDTLFCGALATAAKTRATRIAASMQHALAQQDPGAAATGTVDAVRYWQSE